MKHLIFYVLFLFGMVFSGCGGGSGGSDSTYLSGTVTRYGTGQPVQSATVELYEHGKSTSTDGKGTYSFDLNFNLCNSGLIRISAGGYYTTQLGFLFSGCGGVIGLGNIEIRKTGTITGRVYSKATLKPVQSVKVSLTGTCPDPNEPLICDKSCVNCVIKGSDTTTNADGEFSISTFAGKYKVNCSGPCFPTSDEFTFYGDSLDAGTFWMD